MRPTIFIPFIKLIGLTFLIGFLTSLVSCKVEKRLHRPGYHVEWVKSKKQSPQQRLHDIRETKDLSKPQTHISPPEDFFEPTAEVSDRYFETGEGELNVNAITQEPSQPDCETIVLVDMTEMEVNLIEIGIHDLKFKDCGRSVGKTFTISKSEVARIIYSDGTIEEMYYDPEKEEEKWRSAYAERKNSAPKAKRLDVVSIFSLVFGNFGDFSAVIALLVPSLGGGLIFTVMALTYGIVAFTTGIVSLAKINSSSEQYSGRGAAILGLILGLVSIIFAILIFTAVLIVFSA